MAGAAKVGSIFIGMRVGMGGLSSGLSQASSQLQAFAGFATSNIKAGLGALGVTSAVKGLLDLRDAASATMDTTAKLADRVGASTEGLVGLQHGAKLAGIESGALDTALTKLGVNLARAAAGGKETEGAFARLGLNARQLASMDRVEAFKAIAQAISQIPNPAEQAALAVELFGKAGADLGALLNQGAKGIAAAEAEAKRLGLTFSRADAGQVEAANDAWTRMGNAIGGVGNTLAVALAPAMTSAFETLAGWIAQAQTWFKGLGAWLQSNAATFQSWGAAIGGVGAWFGKLIDKGRELADSFGEFLGESGLGGAIQQAVDAIGQAFNWIGGALAAVGSTVLDVIDGIAFAFRNAGDIVQIVGIQLAEKFINIKEAGEWAFGALGTLGQWFAANWPDVIKTALNAVWTFFNNTFTNIRNLVGAAWDFITNPAGGFHFEFTPLLEGFESSIKQLPNIAGPVFTSLQGQVDEVLGRIAENELARAQAMGKNAVAQVEAVQAASAKAAAFAAPDTGLEKGAKLFGAAMERGSKEARSSILAFQRGGSDDKQSMRDVAQTNREQVELQRQLVAATQATNAALGAALRPVF